MLCEQCGMSYDPGYPEDCVTHAEHHDKVLNGIRATDHNFANSVWTRETDRIVAVNFRSPIEEKRFAERVGNLAKLDCRYDFNPYSAAEEQDERDAHLFLAITGDRAIALLIVELRPSVYRCVWNDLTQVPVPDHSPIWTIGLIWMHRRRRHQGWGRRLVTEAAGFFHLGDAQNFAWSTPFSPDGCKFVKGICPAWFYVAGFGTQPPSSEDEASRRIIEKIFGSS